MAPRDGSSQSAPSARNGGYSQVQSCLFVLPPTTPSATRPQRRTGPASRSATSQVSRKCSSSLNKDAGAKRQCAAYGGDWSKHNPRNAWDRLHESKMPVLVMNGNNDLLMPSSRSWVLMQKIPGAHLIIIH